MQKHALEAGLGCVNELLLDHFQKIVVALYDDMPAIDVGVELLQTEAHLQTLMLNVHIGSLNVSKGFTGKSYEATALKQGSP